MEPTYEAAFICNSTANIDRVYGLGRRNAIEERVVTFPEVISSKNMSSHAKELRTVRFLFSTWGMPSVTPADLNLFPQLEAIFYAAGSVQGFAAPMLRVGIKVISAWAANAVPVAEFTTSLIVLAAKGFFHALGVSHDRHSFSAFRRDNYSGSFDIDIGVLGAGVIGTLVIQALQRMDVRVRVFDPFLSQRQATEIGLQSERIEEVFDKCIVVSNHLADNRGTRGLIDASLFRRLKPNATFINTGRGATVIESDLIEVLSSRKDLTAILDVTDPEPPERESKLYTIENVLLTPHIAGSIGNEAVRLADCVIEEFDRYCADKPLLHAVSTEMLPTMA